MGVWAFPTKFEDGGMGEVVIMTMTYDYNINNWEVFDVAGYLGIALRAHEGEGRATFLEDGIE
jgi:hypothetical protein